ncbi:sensor histidine kinase [Methanobacterium ferruginis]|uniref:sensor histidine kinase n=1 Tax=Methanobacterium ferruginis TaxID=710191 RepID=UPI00257304B0|nr:histidine kinase dimerization/phosphoacceptor domain -containing protein [Methanobacterium ferruginis]BDZ67757.1 hypothetical protein GCM10025860_12050 [Methanobacterium ferruginis]
MKKTRKQINPRYSAFKIALIYFLISLIWIVTSDQLLMGFVNDSQLLTTIAIFKGSLFIIVSAILIYYLIYRNLVSIKRSGEDLKRSEKKFREIFNSANDMISLNLLTREGLPGKFLEVNDVASKRLGYAKEELLNMSPTDLVTPSDRQEMVNADQLLKEGRNRFEMVQVTKNGEKIPVEVNSRIIDFEGDLVLLAVSRDITERKKSEEKLKNSLDEKSLLLREIHHRVKNNLQIISSLFNLQSNYVEGSSKDILMVSQSRVKSMSMIYERLYQSHDLIHINFKDYINNFVPNLFYLYGVYVGDIEPIIDVEDIEIGIDTAIPLGLIINELVTNSLKHAFPEGRKGKIEVSLKKEDEVFTLNISDDGVGMPEESELEKKNTLGLQLVNSLVNQLDGVMEMNGKKGVKFNVIFKELKYKERI